METTVKFMLCPHCRRYAWAKLANGKFFCRECGREIVLNSKWENISSPQTDNTNPEQQETETPKEGV